MCSCPGDCEGGPLPGNAGAYAGDIGKPLWVCRCGKGGTPDLRAAVDPEAARAETERQMINHLRENGHDLLHAVYVGMFSESFCIDAGPDRELLRRRQLGDAPDTYAPYAPAGIGGVK